MYLFYVKLFFFFRNINLLQYLVFRNPTKFFCNVETFICSWVILVIISLSSLYFLATDALFLRVFTAFRFILFIQNLAVYIFAACKINYDFFVTIIKLVFIRNVTLTVVGCAYQILSTKHINFQKSQEVFISDKTLAVCMSLLHRFSCLDSTNNYKIISF